MDSFTHQRVLELRKEIAAVQRESELYKRNRSHTDSEFNTNESRRLRLVAIKEELLRPLVAKIVRHHLGSSNRIRSTLIFKQFRSETTLDNREESHWSLAV